MDPLARRLGAIEEALAEQCQQVEARRADHERWVRFVIEQCATSKSLPYILSIELGRRREAYSDEEWQRMCDRLGEIRAAIRLDPEYAVRREEGRACTT